MAENVVTKRFSSFPLFWLGICFALGILAAKAFPTKFEILLPICVASAVVAGVFVRRAFSFVLIAIAFAAAGSITFLLHQDNVSGNRIKRIYDDQQIGSGEPVEIVGTLVSREELAEGFFVTIAAEQLLHKGVARPVSGRIRLFAVAQTLEMAEDYASMDLRSGTKIGVACNLEREESYQNPGVLSRKTLLDWQDLDATGTLKSPLLLEKLGDGSSWDPVSSVYSARESLIAQFRAKFSGPTAGVMIASLLGNKHFLDKNSAEVFREGGTFHILVISGLHITFIGGLLLLFVSKLARNRLTRFLSVSSILWIYTLAVGAEVPVVRASLMFTILLFSHAIYRSGTLLNSLGACALILLVWRPQDLFGPSFQLTFVSVAAIVVMGFPLIEKLRFIGTWTPTATAPFPPIVPVWLKRFCETIYWREDVWQIETKRHVWSANLFKSPYRRLSGSESLQRVGAFVFEGVLISVIVQLWLLPFLVVYFHRVSILSIPLNLWAGVLIALESFSALTAVGFSFISSALAFPFIKLTEFFNWLLVAVPGWFVYYDWASFRLPVYTGWQGSVYAAYLLPICVLGFAAYAWNPFAMPSASVSRLHLRTLCAVTGSALILGGFIVFHPLSSPGADGRLHIEFLDVGQGDAAFITFPDGRTMLVDGGGQVRYRERDDEDEEGFEPDVPSIGESVVSEFLWELGYSTIDHVVATHADVDHIQGLNDVVKNFRVGTVLVGRSPTSDPDLADLATAARRRGVPMATIALGDTLKFGEVIVEVLYPEATNEADARSDNDHSVVLRLTLGSRSFLLTGDIEMHAESEVVAAGVSLNADLVKVPHHGSRTSSTQAFVDAVEAEICGDLGWTLVLFWPSAQRSCGEMEGKRSDGNDDRRTGHCLGLD